LLRAIAGLEGINSGSIHIGGVDVTRVAPSERDVAMVFQTYALYPHMTVHGNMAFGMKVNGVPREERNRRVTEAARILQLQDYLGRKPGQLSGGQRQRVAIGRAIVKNPKAFLFDEPLSNLDAKLRVQMRIELKSLHEQLGATMIYVTHDQVEAMTMADKIVVLNEGMVEQIGSPLDLYHHPRTEFVAGFLGSPSMNFLDVDARGNELFIADTPLIRHAAAERITRIGIRPEHIGITSVREGLLQATIKVKEVMGGETYLYLRHDGSEHDIVIKTDGDDAHQPGESLGLALAQKHLHAFDASGVSVAVQV